MRESLWERMNLMILKMKYKNLMQEMYGVVKSEQKKKVLSKPIRIERSSTVVEKINEEIEYSPVMKLIKELEDEEQK